jgi:hypothetical protein
MIKYITPRASVNARLELHVRFALISILSARVVAVFSIIAQTSHVTEMMRLIQMLRNIDLPGQRLYWVPRDQLEIISESTSHSCPPRKSASCADPLLIYSQLMNVYPPSQHSSSLRSATHTLSNPQNLPSAALI